MGILLLIPVLLTDSATAYTGKGSGVVPITDTTGEPSPATLEWMPGGWWAIPLGLIMLILFSSWSQSRLTRVPRRPWTFKPAIGYCFVGLTIIAGAIGAQVALGLVGSPMELEAAGDSDGALRALVIVQIISLACQGAVLLAMPGLWTAREPGQEDTRPTIAASVVIGVLGLIIFWPMVHAITLLCSVLTRWVTGEVPGEFAHDTLVLLEGTGDTPWRWGLFAVVVLAVPVVEEVLYRGLLQESLRRHRQITGGSAWLAILLTSTFFTAMHIGVTTWEGMVGLMVLSLGLGWSFARTGRVISAIVMHAGFNAGNLLLAAL